jgi:multidrug resistance efflux pump
MASLDHDSAVAARAAPVKQVAATFPSRRSAAFLRVVATLAIAAVACVVGWLGWRAYMGTPWTRDGAVRAYVVSIAPEVTGRIVELGVSDNQLVRKGDLLIQVDPASYAIAVRQAEAQVAQAKAVAQNAEDEWSRRQKLDSLAVTLEEQQTYASKSLAAQAQYQLALADLENARLNLRRTRIVSPVNGYVTNLLTRVGDYANAGARQVAVIDADSFWVDAYFEETFLAGIRDGDRALVKLMGYPNVLRGRIQSVARGINLANAAPAASGLATVNPIFAFVRLAQRVPVRIHLDEVPSDVRLVAGMTATVQIEPGRAALSAAPAPPVAAIGAPASQPSSATPGGSAAVRAEQTAAEEILSGGVAASPGAPGASPPSTPAPGPPAAVAPQAASPPAPPAEEKGAAQEEAAEVASDKALDSQLDIDGTSPHRHSPELLRKRGGHDRSRHREQ